MKIVREQDWMRGRKCYLVTIPEIQTEEKIYGLVYEIAGLDKSGRIECRGYTDMDTHENFLSFHNRDDFRKNIADVKRIEPETVTVFFRNGEDSAIIKAHLGNIEWDVYGTDKYIEIVLSFLKKKFGK